MRLRRSRRGSAAAAFHICTYMKIEGNIRGFYVEEKFHVANWGTNCPSIVKICIPKTGDASNILLASYRARLSSSEIRSVFSRIGGQTVPQSENLSIAKTNSIFIYINSIMIARSHFSLSPSTGD